MRKNEEINELIEINLNSLILQQNWWNGVYLKKELDNSISCIGYNAMGTIKLFSTASMDLNWQMESLIMMIKSILESKGISVKCTLY